MDFSRLGGLRRKEKEEMREEKERERNLGVLLPRLLVFSSSSPRQRTWQFAGSFSPPLAAGASLSLRMIL